MPIEQILNGCDDGEETAKAMRYHNWPITLPIYAGQDERYDEIAPLYRRMAEWVEERRTLSD